MPTNFLHLAIPAWQIIVRSTVIYLALLLGLRVFGKRQIGQFTLFDLVLILLIANAMQPAMTGPDDSLIGGLLIIGVLLIVNFGVDWLEVHSPLMREVLEGHPTVIAQDGHWLREPMRREGVDPQEADAALREHGLDSIEDVKLAVLEPDGTISIVPRTALTLRTRRRVRFIRRP